jgi:hypothetical protein
MDVGYAEQDASDQVAELAGRLRQDVSQEGKRLEHHGCSLS